MMLPGPGLKAGAIHPETRWPGRFIGISSIAPGFSRGLWMAIYNRALAQNKTLIFL
jgi:hypothetical protein